MKRSREEGEGEESSLRESRRVVLDRMRERREQRREGRLRDHQPGFHQILKECPLCRREVGDGLMEDHLALCLRVVGANGDQVDTEDEEEEEVDVEDDDGWEEYEWAGQRRVRSSSLRLALQEDCSLNQVTIQKTEEREELDILGDSEEDLLDTQELERVSSTLPGQDLRETKLMSSVKDSNINSTPGEMKPDATSSLDSNDGTLPLCENAATDLNVDQSPDEHGEVCKICLSNFSRPLVSTACWHVHCQTCWMRALGAARVCPQCKAPVKPPDLSRVFL